MTANSQPIEKLKSRFDNSLELIGSTPLIKLNTVSPSNGGNIYAKLEFMNPGGSVKDRIAAAATDLAIRFTQFIGRDATCGLTGWTAGKEHERIADDTFYPFYRL